LVWERMDLFEIGFLGQVKLGKKSALPPVYWGKDCGGDAGQIAEPFSLTNFPDRAGADGRVVEPCRPINAGLPRDKPAGYGVPRRRCGFARAPAAAPGCRANAI